jgi:hypothetical protein
MTSNIKSQLFFLRSRYQMCCLIRMLRKLIPINSIIDPGGEND